MDIIKILSNLVSVETINPPGLNYPDMAESLRDLFSDVGLKMSLHEIPEDYLDKNYIYSPSHRGRKRVVLVGRSGPDPKIHFNFHYDVVPAGDQWVSDPFSLRVSGDRAYGRGTADMKGAIVSLYLALSRVKDVSVEVSFVPDEESGGVGSRFLANELHLNPKYMIFGEPSFPNIFIGHFGILRGLIRVKGKQVHASMASTGQNAFLEASRFALRLQDEYSRLFQSAKEGQRPEINLGGYTIGGNSDSLVPGLFSFSFYRTTPPGDRENENVDREIVDRIAKEMGVSYDFEIRSFVPGQRTSLDSKLVKITESCVRKELSFEPSKSVALIRYDAVFFPSSEAVNIGPGEPDQAHIPNESVSIKNIEKTSKIYECIIESF
ncbi:M20 family metallopeptidase [Metallosphaera tengchongensis]|nr:M20 family metallopeptidase [Metallosphaera tengchongensis]